MRKCYLKTNLITVITSNIKMVNKNNIEKMEDDSKSLKESILAASPFLIKVLEIILSVLSLALIVTPYSSKLPFRVNRTGAVYSTFSGAIIINSLIIISHCLGERIPKKSCLIVATFYGVMYLVAGYLVMDDWRNITDNFQLKPPREYVDLLLASGVFAFLTSATFFVDVLLSVKYA